MCSSAYNNSRSVSRSWRRGRRRRKRPPFPRDEPRTQQLPAHSGRKHRPRRTRARAAPHETQEQQAATVQQMETQLSVAADSRISTSIFRRRTEGDTERI